MSETADNQPKSKIWIAYAFLASILFMIADAAKAEMSNESGFGTIMYNSTGTVIVCLGFNLKQSFSNYRKNGVFWNNQGLIVDGKLNKLNVLCMAIYVLIIFLVQSFVILTILMAGKA